MDTEGTQPSAGNNPRVYAVVVNWNRPEDTLTCLQSLAALEQITPRLVVVDNGSTDDSVVRIQEAFPTAEVIQSAENLGYAPGANLGIQFAIAEQADYIFLLNNDATVEHTTLIELLQHDRAGVGILAPMIYFADPPNKIWSIGGDTNPLTLEKSSPRRNTDDRGGWPETIERDFFPGTAILVSRKTFEKVGVFDKQFQMYYDDADFSERVRRAGLKILVIPNAKAWHKVSASSGGSDSPNERYWMARSSIVFFRKFASPWQWLAIVPYRLGSALRTSLRLLRRGAYPAVGAYWRGLVDGLRQPPI